MAKGVTLTDIAERVGVSNVAVHKALTDKPGVNAELRSKIKALAKEMGYTGTASAAGKAKAGEDRQYRCGHSRTVLWTHFFVLWKII